MALTVFDVLRCPLVTEKSSFQNDKLGQYVFEVAADATKTQIKEAVETLFEVNVARVNTLVMPAKRARKQRRMTTRSSQYKKALVKLASGETIEMFEGVK
ncbi:MAG: 50S ribosomal protein L23 [Anaerolineales bacterium]|jgi:large subunit ribosomal protein L23|nr:50S ribosomal protein L23 [Anaerolineales bacterium]HJO33256.1 50S ribosomal protein L23 [Anaerolineales bacterium]